jgi:hypothetical protein
VDVKRSSATSCEHPNGRRAVAPVGGVWGSLLLRPARREPTKRSRGIEGLGTGAWNAVVTRQAGTGCGPTNTATSTAAFASGIRASGCS